MWTTKRRREWFGLKFEGMTALKIMLTNNKDLKLFPKHQYLLLMLASILSLASCIRNPATHRVHARLLSAEACERGDIQSFGFVEAGDDHNRGHKKIPSLGSTNSSVSFQRAILDNRTGPSTSNKRAGNRSLASIPTAYPRQICDRGIHIQRLRSPPILDKQ